MELLAQNGLQQSNKASKNKNYSFKVNNASIKMFPTASVVRLTVTINYKSCTKPCQNDLKCDLVVNVGTGQTNNQPKLKEIKCTPLNLRTTGTPLEFYKTPQGEFTNINITDNSN